MLSPLPSSQMSVAVWSGFQFPELEFVGRHQLVEALRQSDFVKKPIGPAVLGHVFCAVGVEDVAGERVAIPVFAAGELRQVGLGECFRVGHGSF